MKRAFMILAAVLSLGCGTSTGPSALYSSYFLQSVDGHLLPVPYADDGTVLLASSLGFGLDSRPRVDGPATGMVSYFLTVRRPDQTVEHSSIELEYSIRDGILRINLCPPLALCIVSTELAGPITDRTSELVLTNYLAGQPGSVYRFFPTLPD